MHDDWRRLKAVADLLKRSSIYAASLCAPENEELAIAATLFNLANDIVSRNRAALRDIKFDCYQKIDDESIKKIQKEPIPGGLKANPSLDEIRKIVATLSEVEKRYSAIADAFLSANES